MIGRIIDLFESIPATATGGVFLILSFVFSKLGVDFPVDPAWLPVIISGFPILYSAIRKMIHNHGISKISSALLISIAMIAAICIGDLFAAGEVAFIMALGEILEDVTTSRAKKGLNKLISLTPTQGRKIVDGEEKMIAAEDICKNDIIRILPGETVAVDGIIIKGESSVDQSVITGEALPVDKRVGDEVFCGTVNCFGAIDIKATKVGESSSLKKLIRLVQEAENKKAPMARVADKAASWLVPLALLTAIITGIITKDITRAVTVLVVFCPCALVLATPTAIMAAIGQATKYGVIIKSGEALEKLGRANVVAFDKTGTLTSGKLQISDVITFDESIANDKLLSIAASVEAKSEHPLGKAIVDFAKEKNISLSEATEFKMSAGSGVCAEIDGIKVFCGNENYIVKNGIDLKDEIHAVLKKLRKQGKASVIIAVGGGCVGVIALSDTIRPEAAEVIAKLKEMNTESILLTGDNELAAQYFALQTGISEVKADLLPEQKVESILKIQNKGKKVCMVGDGVNDAPALKTASVGVAMGCMGSDISVEAADITLMRDDITKIPYLKKLSNATVSTIKLSITLSMCINFLAVALSVAGVLNPTTGALVHNAGSCFVILIAALLYDRKFE